MQAYYSHVEVLTHQGKINLEINTLTNLSLLCFDVLWLNHF